MFWTTTSRHWPPRCGSAWRSRGRLAGRRRLHRVQGSTSRQSAAAARTRRGDMSQKRLTCQRRGPDRSRGRPAAGPGVGWLVTARRARRRRRGGQGGWRRGAGGRRRCRRRGARDVEGTGAVVVVEGEAGVAGEEEGVAYRRYSSIGPCRLNATARWLRRGRGRCWRRGSSPRPGRRRRRGRSCPPSSGEGAGVAGLRGVAPDGGELTHRAARRGVGVRGGPERGREVVG